MKLLIDINHPAHVHYSKYVIKELLSKGHSVIVTARNRDPSFELLNNEKIEFHNRGKGSNSFWGKLIYFLKGDYEILKIAKKYKPDLFVCFMSPYAAQVSKLMGKPCIIIDDTEHAKLHDKFSYPFCDIILTPSCFYRDLGAKHIRFNSFLELNYLHPNRNKPDTGIYNLLGITNGQPYVVLRLVAWGGHHDFGHSGLSTAVQEQIVSLLSKDYKVFISSETALPEFFEPYRIRLPSYKIHDLLAFATLFIGESGTMAGESVILGTPVIYVNSLPLMGYLQEAQRNGLLFHFSDDQQVVLKVEELLAMKDVKETFRANHRKHLEGKIDGTSFLVWFLENYPKSAEIMRSDPEYQLEFDPIKY